MDTPLRTLIAGGELALPHGTVRADLLMEEERISAIGTGLEALADEIIDAGGCVVLPGAIDTHTHFDLPVSGTVTADDFESGTRAAIFGGTTTVLDFATQDRGGTLREGYDAWRARMDGHMHCDVGLHMAITDWNDETSREVESMFALGVPSFKLYMAYPALMVEDDAIYQALKRITAFGGIAGVHCENGRLVAALTEELTARGHLDPVWHPCARPPQVEAEAVSRLLSIAELAESPVNIVHLSSEAGLCAVEAARQRGQRVFVETCPQYLLLDDSLYAQSDSVKYICSPPLRGRDDARALWQALAAGRIDTIGTDHCSFNYAGQKTAGEQDFTKTPNGLPGVEHRLSLMMTEGVAKGRMTLSHLVRVLSENPARLFGLYPQKGVLATGSDADIVLWDPRAKQTIRAASQVQRVDYTPYEGFMLEGAVRDVWLRGTHVVSNGGFIDRNRGKYVERRPPFSKKP